jgi:hypothetical protein
LTNLHKSNNSCVGPHGKHLCQIQNGHQRRSTFALKLYGKQHFHLLLENSRTEFNQTWQKCFLWGPKKRICTKVTTLV